MLTDTSRWSHARGNEVVPSRWQATVGTFRPSRWARDRSLTCDDAPQGGALAACPESPLLVEDGRPPPIRPQVSGGRHLGHSPAAGRAGAMRPCVDCGRWACLAGITAVVAVLPVRKLP
jgi:hypothetical protein